MKTCSVTPSDIKKKWVTVDAAEKPLGRVASEIAYILRGKNKPTFVPHLDCGDNVIVVNAEKVALTGQKWDQKLYYHHTGYVGGIKSIKAKDLLESHPDRLITKAVRGMLPKNKLARHILKNLRVYKGTEHPHGAQGPVVAKPRLQRGDK